MSGKLCIVHIIYRLDFGGMENGLVNLVNRLPREKFTHVILCLTHATAFRHRIRRDDVEIIECRKPEGKHPPTYWKVYKELRRLRPDIVHTRNLGALDMSWVARLAGCQQRIHSEHGWTADDPKGHSRKYRALRKICDPAVGRYLAVSRDIAHWLVDTIGIAADKVETLHNGVDLSRFAPSPTLVDEEIETSNPRTEVVFGTLGRQDAIKGLDVFLTALRALIGERPEWVERLRVIMAGDGPERARYMSLRDEYDLHQVVEFPGAVDDVPGLLRQFDFFVQPSLNEGISNTVLEAMASGLPIIATDVGGNPELVRDGIEGRLVAPGDVDRLRMALSAYIEDAELRQRQGIAARQRAEDSFSFEVMCARYERLYRSFFAQPAAAA